MAPLAEKKRRKVPVTFSGTGNLSSLLFFSFSLLPFTASSGTPRFPWPGGGPWGAARPENNFRSCWPRS